MGTEMAEKGPVVTMVEAGRLLGVSQPTLLRLIAERELEVFRSLVDRRAKFLRLEDVRSLQRRSLRPIAKGPRQVVA